MEFPAAAKLNFAKGMDGALRRPRRRAQRQATETNDKNARFATRVPPFASLRAGTSQRDVPTI